MKDINGEITYRDKKYKIVFNFNVMEQIQEEYGSIEKWGSLTDGSAGEPNAKAVIFGFTAMINEGIDIENEENGTDIKPLTKRQVGRLMTEIGLEETAQKMADVVVDSTKSDDSKNV